MRLPIPAVGPAIPLAAVLIALSPAQAQESAAAPIAVDLNRLEDRGGACRLHFVFANPTDRVFEQLTLDLVLFDPDGVIAERVALEAAPLLADKTMVKQFDIAGRSCAEIGRVLINDVTRCADGDGPVEGCIGLLAPRATADAELFR